MGISSPSVLREGQKCGRGNYKHSLEQLHEMMWEWEMAIKCSRATNTEGSAGDALILPLSFLFIICNLVEISR